MRIRTALLTALMAILVAAPLDAQSWDVPSFFPPRPGSDIGLYLTDEGDATLFGIWRDDATNLGLRAGITFADETAGHVGATVHGALLIADADVPVDLGWMLGAGATFVDDFVLLWIPVGLSVGRMVPLEGVTLQPYVHPRVGLDIRSFNDDTDLDIGGVIDLGVDAHLDSFIFRFGAAFGTFDALGFGIAFPTGRRAVVR